MPLESPNPVKISEERRDGIVIHLIEVPI